jgi:hypothetical protein
VEEALVGAIRLARVERQQGRVVGRVEVLELAAVRGPAELALVEAQQVLWPGMQPDLLREVPEEAVQALGVLVSGKKGVVRCGYYCTG